MSESINPVRETENAYIIEATGIPPSTSDMNAIWWGLDNILPIMNINDAYYALFFGTENQCRLFCAEAEDDWENPEVKYEFTPIN